MLQFIYKYFSTGPYTNMEPHFGEEYPNTSSIKLIAIGKSNSNIQHTDTAYSDDQDKAYTTLCLRSAASSIASAIPSPTSVFPASIPFK